MLSKPNRKVLITKKLNIAYGPTNHAVNQLADICLGTLERLLREREGESVPLIVLGRNDV
jgi:hypothetical protein